MAPVSEEDLANLWVERDYQDEVHADGKVFDHYHHKREFYDVFIICRRFDTREEAMDADRYNGFAITIGCDATDCDVDC